MATIAATLVPEVWAPRLLGHMDKAHIAAGLVNRDYEGEITAAGDTVRVSRIGPVTIGTYTPNSNMAEPETLTADQLVMTIDQFKYFAFSVDDVDRRQANVDFADDAVARASYGLADVEDQYLLAQGLAGAGTTLAAFNLSATTPYEVMNAIATQLTKNNVPQSEERFVVVHPDFGGRLRLDARVNRATAAGDEVARRGYVGMVEGLAIYESMNIASNTILAGTRQAISFAHQITEFETLRHPYRFATIVRGLVVYGAKVFEPDALVKTTWTAS